MTGTFSVEVTNISPNGIWLLANEEELPSLFAEKHSKPEQYTTTAYPTVDKREAAAVNWS